MTKISNINILFMVDCLHNNLFMWFSDYFGSLHTLFCSYIQTKAAQGRILVDVGMLFLFSKLLLTTGSLDHVIDCALNRFLGRSGAGKCIQCNFFGTSS